MDRMVEIVTWSSVGILWLWAFYLMGWNHGYKKGRSGREE